MFHTPAHKQAQQANIIAAQSALITSQGIRLMDANDKLAAIKEEQKDWARRFMLDGKTPWEWENLAKRHIAETESLKRTLSCVKEELDLAAVSLQQANVHGVRGRIVDAQALVRDALK